MIPISILPVCDKGLMKSRDTVFPSSCVIRFSEEWKINFLFLIPQEKDEHFGTKNKCFFFWLMMVKHEIFELKFSNFSNEIFEIFL